LSRVHGALTVLDDDATLLPHPPGSCASPRSIMPAANV
jgi:hypothetical protein